MTDLPILHVKNLGKADYQPVWQAMKDFTDGRDAHTPDELWLVEHPPVFTQGQAGKAEHLLAPGAIPVVATDRGGQVTYHGPGQLVAYPLLDLRRLKIGVRELVTKIEQSVVALLAEYKIDSAPKADAPGVYVNGDKIASLGLRVRKGCSFHGVAINVDVDLAPFNQINPCGYAGLNMTRLVDLVDTTKQPVVFSDVAKRYTRILSNILGLTAQLKE
ncbi:lipoyl(octanoyl) transferase LipB [Saccharophagus degradans]|uniref:Octanoyltransferase n=1 Tax=Saccharophagus degradans (strain 2-40 / ATCC 43961 / DSM 17024) TaxID=203122 RepID=LIPB_SACD2|nr:lipoyl(octanoyl) transferase LipB [Saccharophagus degradans]Q21FD9.1 RecName: Full=Octanoyltransferase; AltName: Full=Lipoate-protein ligase B; AltName: Full=Lipoyl/octanoyl transferase; AltName: Full=Octanoyl-[acyl-carrier-protein]-protein N-octanoyltransferase [Saccharophagus degradans 2-40]ABD82590.1 lipoate-protein ligase B [Saccharophagus degradans 2-40]